MSDIVAELADRGRNLSPEQRVRLMDLLLESLDQPASDTIEGAWAREIELRVARYERGETELENLADVMAEATRIAP